MTVLMPAAEPPHPEEAIHWLELASKAGHARAQYQLALCLHQGCGVDRNLPQAVTNFFGYPAFTFCTYTLAFSHPFSPYEFFLSNRRNGI